VSIVVRGWLRGFLLGLAVLAAPVACQAQRSETVQAVMPEVTVAELPAEARETIALIHKGGPYPYAKDGAVFGNREGVLPRAKRGYYREYTVKTPGVRTRGARRVVAGAGGELYYSDDHYNHFRRVRE
jgi:ribonuclease T1